MYPKSAPWWKKLFVVTEIFIGINILILDIYLFHLFTHPDQRPITTTQQQEETIKIPISSESALSLQPTTIPTPTAKPAVPGSYTIANNQILVKEYFVPFGSGQGTSTEWTTIPGLQAYVDSNSYPNISQITFEATVRVPTANQTVSLRLFNSTDGHPVWFSDLNFAGNADGAFLASQKISLDPGNKLYVVQMKTQLGSTGLIDQARMHITLR